jgi:hypothetical protein
VKGNINRDVFDVISVIILGVCGQPAIARVNENGPVPKLSVGVNFFFCGVTRRCRNEYEKEG